jgi:Bacterial PH domain
VTAPVLGTLRRIRDGRVRRRLLREDDAREDIVDEVHHHWVVYTVPMLEVVLALGVLWLLLVSSSKVGWVLLAVLVALLCHAGWRALVEFMDVFVITNMRVFRVTGVFSSKHATTPLARILDITVDQPFLGLLLGFGHFTFESAAHEQGLRDIRYVPKPLERDLVIQRHVQLSGLRGPRTNHQGA